MSSGDRAGNVTKRPRGRAEEECVQSPLPGSDERKETHPPSLVPVCLGRWCRSGDEFASIRPPPPGPRSTQTEQRAATLARWQLLPAPRYRLRGWRRSPRRARSGPRAPTASCTESATRPMRSSRSSRARWRSSTPPGRNPSGTALGFLGEVNLLSDQTVCLNASWPAAALRRRRAGRAPRAAVRGRPAQRYRAVDLHRPAGALQRVGGMASRSSSRDRPRRRSERASSPGPTSCPTRGTTPHRDGTKPPLVRSPGESELSPRAGRGLTGPRIGRELAPREESTC